MTLWLKPKLSELGLIPQGPKSHSKKVGLFSNKHLETSKQEGRVAGIYGKLLRRLLQYSRQKRGQEFDESGHGQRQCQWVPDILAQDQQGSLMDWKWGNWRRKDGVRLVPFLRGLLLHIHLMISGLPESVSLSEPFHYWELLSWGANMCGSTLQSLLRSSLPRDLYVWLRQ